jgi:sulfide:quinone oxidoreductase
MTRSYTALWREGDGPEHAGGLEVAFGHLSLEGRTRIDPTAARTRVALDEIEALRIERSVGERMDARPTLVVTRGGGPSLRIAIPGPGLLHEVSDAIGASLATRVRPERGAPLSVVVVGGGVGALEAVLTLRALAQERVSITLVSPSTRFVYRPLAVKRPFEAGPEPGVDLALFAADAGARLVTDTVVDVDVTARRVHTAGGRSLHYDALLVSVGARPEPALPGAIPFWDWGTGNGFRALLGELSRGESTSLAFAVPGGTVWPLPLYELALLTAAHLDDLGVAGARLTFVTPEAEPLGIFGRESSAAVAGALARRGIRLLTGATPLAFRDGALHLAGGRRVTADHAASVPRLRGPALAGLPHDAAGFISTDPYGHVDARLDVFAAGDATTFPVKQGGIAAQQAETAATAIAAQAGAPVRPEPLEPVLRALLLTADAPIFLRTELEGGRGETGDASADPLWWPPTKVVGHHLSGYLASRVRQVA